jgi:hypothetical protein
LRRNFDYLKPARNKFAPEEFLSECNIAMEIQMSVKGQIKEATGYTKEEAYEHGKSPESQKKAQEGRNLRNEGRVEDGKAPKTTKPGTHQ